MKNFIYYLLFLTTTWGFMATAALAQNCPQNTNVSSNTTPNGTTITWDAVAGAMQYELRYRKAGTSALTAVITTTNSFTFTTLPDNVCYEFALRTICSGNDIGPWLFGQSFCTAGPSGFCAIPSNITSTPMVNNATLNWTAVAGAQAYEIRYRKVGTAALTYLTTATNSLSIGGLVSNTCYEFSIRSQCDTNNFSPWLIPGQSFCTQPLAQPCTIPSNINTSHNPNATILSWNAVSNAIGYEIRYRKVGTSALTYVSTTTNNIALSNLIGNTCYEFSIRSQCDSLEFSPWLIPGQSFCVPGSSGFCAIPSNITSTPVANAATLNWSAVAGAQAYEIRYREVGTSTLTYVSTTTNSLTLNGLMASTCYEFSIRSQCDSNNFSPWLIPGLSFCVPGSSGFCVIPSNITSTTTSTTAQINWMALNNAQGYEIRYREVGTGPVTYASTTTNSLTLNGLLASTCYEFSIRAQCGPNNFSSWLIPGLSFCTDSIINVPCPTPTNPNVDSIGRYAAVFSWVGNTNTNFGYQIRYRALNSSNYTIVPTNNTAIFINNLQGQTCYEYSVRAVCDTINPNYSPWTTNNTFCTDSLPCTVPYNVVDSVGTTSAYLTWIGNTNANFGYQIRYRPFGTTTYTSFQTNNPSTFISNLQDATCYQYNIRSICDTISGNYSNWTANDFFCTDSIINVPCTVPYNIVDSIGTTTTALTWTGSTNANVGYEIRYIDFNSNNPTYTVIQTYFPSVFLRNLQHATCYTYNIRSICDTSSGNYSNWTADMSLCTDTLPCTPPIIISVDSTTTNTAYISWDNYNSPVAGYEVRYAIIGRPYTTITTNNLMAVLQNLQIGTCYTFNVRTVCNYRGPNENSAWSDSITFCTNFPPCPLPVTINDSAGINNVWLSWSNVSGAQGYEIRYREVGTGPVTYTSSSDNSEFLFNLMPGTCYEYSIRTLCDSTLGNYSPWLIPGQLFCTDTIPLPPCPSPTNINTDSVDLYSAVLSWTGNTNASFGYEVRYRALGTSNYMVDAVYSTSTVLNNLQDQTCYEYSVRSVCDTINPNYSSWTTTTIFCTDTLPCTPPNSVVDSTGTTSAYLAWNGNNSANFGYEIRYRPFGATNYSVFQTNTPSIFLRNLQDATCYLYNIRSICDSLSGEYSSWTTSDFFCTDTLPCPTPTNPSVDTTTTTLAYLSWDGNNRANFGYQVRYAMIGGTYTTFVTGNTTSVLQNLQPGACYAFSVRTICDTIASNDYSPWSTNVRFCTSFPPCPTPTNFSELVDTSYAFLDWSTVSGAHGYEIRYREVGTSTLTYVSSADSEEFLNGLMPGTCYEYSVRTLCDSVIGNYSAWLVPGRSFCTDTITLPPCPIPTNTNVDSAGQHAVLISWTGNPNATFGYEIRYRALNSPNYQFVTEYNTTAFINLLQDQTCYEYSVRSICDTIHPNYSPWTTNDVFCTSDPSSSCARPTSTFMSNINPTLASFNWTPVVGAISYEVRFRLLGTNNSYNLLYSTDTTAFYQGFQPGACYEYNVRTACDTVSSYSLWSTQDTFCIPTMRLNGSNGDATTVDNFHSITKGDEETPIRYTLFPNPTTGQVTIKFDHALTTTYTVRVFNILGAEVTPTVLKRGEEVCTLDLFSLTNGLYMIEISTAQQRWTEQVQVYK